MSLKHAMAFIQKAFSDPILKEEIEQLENPKKADEVAALGFRLGYDFTPEELRQAFSIDWKMRWHHFASKIGKKRSSSNSCDLS